MIGEWDEIEVNRGRGMGEEVFSKEREGIKCIVGIWIVPKLKCVRA